MIPNSILCMTKCFIFTWISVWLMLYTSRRSFVYLRKLILLAPICCFWLKHVIESLKSTPGLECLVLENEYYNQPTSNEECLGVMLEEIWYIYIFGYISVQLNWSASEFLPSCLLSQLKTVAIRAVKARVDEIEVAKYLLKNGEVLKKMTFHAPEFGLTKRRYTSKF